MSEDQQPANIDRPRVMHTAWRVMAALTIDDGQAATDALLRLSRPELVAVAQLLALGHLTTSRGVGMPDGVLLAHMEKGLDGVIHNAVDQDLGGLDQ